MKGTAACLVWSQRRSGAQERFLLTHEFEELLLEAGVVTEVTTNNRVDHAGLRFTHSAPLHAVVLRLDDDAKPLGFAKPLDFISQNHHGLFLDVRA